MAFEIITLNLIPDGEMPVFHASQFDTARPVIIDLVMGEDAYVVPEGITLELHCRKVDDTIVTMEPDEVTGNRVTFVTTEQLTACIGDNLCEVALLNGDDHIGTLNFILHVEPDPLAGGLTSESDIYNLTQQIEDIAEEVIGEDYYDKTEVDALLADKADVSDLPDMSNYYTKSETYSSGQIDYSMNLKADKSELDDYALKTWVTTNFVTPSYLGIYYYNKTQVDALLYNMLPEGTASGAIASFNTEIAGNLTALKCNMLASGGGGTPDNPIPIVGFTELNVKRCGKQLWNEQYEVGQFNPSTGVPVVVSNAIRTKEDILIPSGTSFAILFPDGISGRIYYLDNNKTMVLTETIGSGVTVKTMPSGCCYLRFHTSTSYGETYNNNIAVLYPSTETQYVQYNGETITLDLNGTRYGCYVDVNNGKLVVTHNIVDLGDLNYSKVTLRDTSKFAFSATIPDMETVVDSNYKINALCSNYQIYTGGQIWSNGLVGVSGWGTNTHNIGIYDDSLENIDVNAFKTAMSGVMLVYELATPIEIDISPEHLYANVGQNNVFHDCNGTTEVKYKDTIQHYIDTRL